MDQPAPNDLNPQQNLSETKSSEPNFPGPSSPSSPIGPSEPQATQIPQEPSQKPQQESAQASQVSPGPQEPPEPSAPPSPLGTQETPAPQEPQKSPQEPREFPQGSPIQEPQISPKPQEPPRAPSEPSAPPSPPEPSQHPQFPETPQTPQAPPTPQKTEGLPPPPSPPASPVKKRFIGKKAFILSLATVLFLILVTAGFFAYKYFFANPGKVLNEALGKFSEINSLFAVLETPGINTETEFTYHRAGDQFSKLCVTISEIGGDKKRSFKGSAVFNQDHAYFLTSYTHIKEIDTAIKNFYPPIAETDTYKLTQPVLLGQKWLHVSLPQTTKNLQETQQEFKSQISEVERQKLGGILKKTLLFKTYDGNFVLEGKLYKKIVIGLRKQELVKFLEELKNLNIDIEVSQINSLIKLVNSVDNWDDDLFEVLIDEDGYIYSASLSLPQIPEEALKEGLEEGIEDTSTWGLVIKDYASMFEEWFKSKKKGVVINLGTVKFSNYDSAPEVEIPEKVVELEMILKKAQEELLPIFASMFSSYLGPYGISTAPELPLELPDSLPVQ